MKEHPDDPCHVILDALSTLRAVIKDDEFDIRAWHVPWLSYDPEALDPKTTEDGYMVVLDHAVEIVTRRLERGEGLCQ